MRRTWAAWTVFASLGIAAHADELDTQLEKLAKGGDEGAAALQQIDLLPIDKEGAVRLVRAAVREWPQLPGVPVSTSARLLSRAGCCPSAALLPAVSWVYDSLRGRKEAQEQALRLPLLVQSDEGIALFLELLVRPAGADADPIIAASELYGSSDFVKKAIRQVLPVLPKLKMRSSFYSILTHHAAGDWFRWVDFPKETEGLILRATVLCREQGPGIDKTYGSWPRLLMDPKTRDSVPEVTALACDELRYLADMLATVPGSNATDALYFILALKSRYLQVFAALALLGHGERVDPVLLEDLASRPSERYWLWYFLRENAAKKLPAKYSSQKDIAEAWAVNHMEFLLNMDRTPSKVEFLKEVRHTRQDGQKVTTWFFRCSDPDVNGGKGVITCAGPFFRDGEKALDFAAVPHHPDREQWGFSLDEAVAYVIGDDTIESK